MRVLAGDLAADAATIRRAKHAEFHSLGLVLGYTYAGSPVVQNSVAAQKVEDVTTYTPTTAPGSRLPHHWLADGSSLYDHLGTGLTLIGPEARTDLRVTALPLERGAWKSRSPCSTRRRPIRGTTNSCWSAPISTSPGRTPIRRASICGPSPVTT
jgi:hypothetical protein